MATAPSPSRTPPGARPPSPVTTAPPSAPSKAPRARAGSPPAAVTFSPNGSNAARSSTATFAKAGSYSFQVTIRDPHGQTAVSSVTVTVQQIVKSIAVSPSSATVSVGATKQFSATAKDQ